MSSMDNHIDKKMLIIVNGICFACLFGLLIIKLLLGNVIFVLLLACWFVFIIYANIGIIVKNTDVTTAIKSADKAGIFHYYTKQLIDAYNSIMSRQEMFQDMDEDDKVRGAYELIAKQVISNIKSAIQYMQTYDYVTRPTPDYLDKLCKNNKKLLSRVSELIEVVIQIDSTADDVDLTKVDDILESLRSVLVNE